MSSKVTATKVMAPYNEKWTPGGDETRQEPFGSKVFSIARALQPDLKPAGPKN